MGPYYSPLTILVEPWGPIIPQLLFWSNQGALLFPIYYSSGTLGPYYPPLSILVEPWGSIIHHLLF
jgi:hypothetical protein